MKFYEIIIINKQLNFVIEHHNITSMIKFLCSKQQ